MIPINGKYSVFRDKYQWVLVEHYTNKKGNPDNKEAYFPWFDMAMRSAAENSCQGIKTIKDMERRYRELTVSIQAAGKSVAENLAPVLAELAETKAALKRAENQLNHQRKAA